MDSTNVSREGHRKRLRTRFLQNGLDGFLDYEIVELLLTLGTPRRDCKQIAKDAIQQLGGLQEVLDATIVELQKVKGIGQYNAFGIKLFQAISERYAKENVQRLPVLESPIAVADYLQNYIGREKKECFVMLALDSQSRLIKVSNISIGSLVESIVHPREVFKEAIQASAAQIIIAHNHPSGSLEKSREDITVTNMLVTAGDLLDIPVIDHIIVTTQGSVSFREEGWI
jgi:DNA repair protein RadC